MAETQPPPPPSAIFRIDGVIANMQKQPGEPNYGECRCCNGRGHVFWYGIHLPYQVPGTKGPTEAQPRDWINTILDDYRFDAGRPVRITVEILDTPEGNADVPAP